jgi:hypothetical protein
MLIYAFILIFLKTIAQHLILFLIAYFSFFIVEQKIYITKILKCLLYMTPGIIGFAIAAFIFNKDYSSIEIRLQNTTYLAVHFICIILISFLYTSAINFNSLVIYFLKRKFLSFSLAYALIMIDMTAKFIMQDWKNIFIAYRMRGYSITNIIKPIFLLLLNSINYAQDMSINAFVRGIILERESTTTQAHIYYKNIGSSLTQTVSILWWQYFLLFLPLIVLAFNI